MSALYWPDFDCTASSRGIEHSSTEPYHCSTDREAALTFLDVLGFWIPQQDGFGTFEKYGARHGVGLRYACIRGPGGLVRGVMDKGRRIA